MLAIQDHRRSVRWRVEIREFQGLPIGHHAVAVVHPDGLLEVIEEFRQLTGLLGGEVGQPEVGPWGASASGSGGVPGWGISQVLQVHHGLLDDGLVNLGDACGHGRHGAGQGQVLDEARDASEVMK